jgi:hypothetical protein
MHVFKKFDCIVQALLIIASTKEISPYNIKPAHLHEYFVSKKGQFKLTSLHGSKTLLEGTTWYIHNQASWLLELLVRFHYS